MSTRNYVEELEYNDAKGLDTTSPVSMVSPGYVREARNVNLGATGGYTKRQGFTAQLTTKWTGAADDLSIRAAVEYKKSDGTLESIFYGTNDTDDGRIGKENAGAVTTILSGLSSTDRMSFVQVEDRLLGFNGDSVNAPFIYEGGTSTRDLGIAAPTVAPTLTPGTGAAAGKGLEVGSYVYAYTYIIREVSSQRLLAESSPSSLETVEIASGEDKCTVGLTASGITVPGSLEVLIRVYRTLVAGSVLFLEDTVTDATGNFTSEEPDSSMSDTQMSLDNTQLDQFTGYTKAKYPVVARNRLFISHENRNEVRFSKIGQEGPLPESFPAINFVSVEGKQGSSDQIVGMGQIKGVPIVLKERSVGRLEEVGLPEITNAEDPVTYIYREISDSIGAVSHFAHSQVIDELVFLGRDNIYATNGLSVRPIADMIQSTIKALDYRANKETQISMVNDSKNRRLYIALYETTTEAEPNFVVVGDYQQYPQFRWTFYGEGTDSSTHPGVRAGSFFQFTNTSDGTVDTYFGNTDGNGQYYKMNDTDSDTDYSTGADRGIAFKLVSRPYAFGQPLVTKLYKNSRIYAQASDDDYQFDFCTIFNLSSEEEFCQQFTVPGIGNNWNEHNWVDDAETEADPLIWAGPGLAELTHNSHRKAKFMQLVFKQEDSDAPATLLGWGVSGSIFGGI